MSLRNVHRHMLIICACKKVIAQCPCPVVDKPVTICSVPCTHLPDPPTERETGQ